MIAIMMTSADLVAVCKPFAIQEKNLECIYAEFYAQVPKTMSKTLVFFVFLIYCGYIYSICLDSNCSLYFHYFNKLPVVLYENHA